MPLMKEVTCPKCRAKWPAQATMSRFVEQFEGERYKIGQTTQEMEMQCSTPGCATVIKYAVRLVHG